ncbi:hypothetical protein MRB53_027484 [Persea americana]|uniref:Uncharacterized protein n=1 Tax=Persea americana TaxID=3435 RepID=A0ACC2LL88_PERAE|nr:hypothetical protein MRB53_027484 [Persea americana]
MPQTGSERIHQGRRQDGDRIRCDGVRWVFREARLYPHQQYHRRIRLGEAMQERQDSEMVEAVKSNSVVFRSAERMRFFF